jgi:hypothetical protein
MGGAAGVAKKLSIYASGVTLKYSPEVPETTIALYTAILLRSTEVVFLQRE